MAKGMGSLTLGHTQPDPGVQTPANKPSFADFKGLASMATGKKNIQSAKRPESVQSASHQDLKNYLKSKVRPDGPHLAPPVHHPSDQQLLQRLQQQVSATQEKQPPHMQTSATRQPLQLRPPASRPEDGSAQKARLAAVANPGPSLGAQRLTQQTASLAQSSPVHSAHEYADLSLNGDAQRGHPPERINPDAEQGVHPAQPGEEWADCSKATDTGLSNMMGHYTDGDDGLDFDNSSKEASAAAGAAAAAPASLSALNISSARPLTPRPSAAETTEDLIFGRKRNRATAAPSAVSRPAADVVIDMNSPGQGARHHNEAAQHMPGHGVTCNGNVENSSAQQKDAEAQCIKPLHGAHQTAGPHGAREWSPKTQPPSPDDCASSLPSSTPTFAARTPLRDGHAREPPASAARPFSLIGSDLVDRNPQKGTRRPGPSPGGRDLRSPEPKGSALPATAPLQNSREGLVGDTETAPHSSRKRSRSAADVLTSHADEKDVKLQQMHAAGLSSKRLTQASAAPEDCRQAAKRPSPSPGHDQRGSFVKNMAAHRSSNKALAKGQHWIARAGHMGGLERDVEPPELVHAADHGHQSHTGDQPAGQASANRGRADHISKDVHDLLAGSRQPEHQQSMGLRESRQQQASASSPPPTSPVSLLQVECPRAGMLGHFRTHLSSAVGGVVGGAVSGVVSGAFNAAMEVSDTLSRVMKVCSPPKKPQDGSADPNAPQAGEGPSRQGQGVRGHQPPPMAGQVPDGLQPTPITAQCAPSGTSDAHRSSRPGFWTSPLKLHEPPLDVMQRPLQTSLKGPDPGAFGKLGGLLPQQGNRMGAHAQVGHMSKTLKPEPPWRNAVMSLQSLLVPQPKVTHQDCLVMSQEM